MLKRRNVIVMFPSIWQIWKWSNVKGRLFLENRYELWEAEIDSLAILNRFQIMAQFYFVVVGRWLFEKYIFYIVWLLTLNRPGVGVVVTATECCVAQWLPEIIRNLGGGVRLSDRQLENKIVAVVSFIRSGVCTSSTLHWRILTPWTRSPPGPSQHSFVKSPFYMVFSCSLESFIWSLVWSHMPTAQPSHSFTEVPLRVQKSVSTFSWFLFGTCATVVRKIFV